MAMNTCELCGFKNPKGTATAAIIQDNRLLVLKRNEEPYKGMGDLPGGFMHADETPDQTIRRELLEELGIRADITFMKQVPGSALWKGEAFPIVSSFYLADIGDQTVTLNDENSAYEWIPLSEIQPDAIAYDSNQAFARWLKKEFSFDLRRIRELTAQLDSSAVIHEQALYRAKLNGYVATRYDNEKLIGMGWIFPRQTALRKQAVVEDMIVDDAYRGRGLGRELLNDLVVWARGQNIEMIELTSNPKRIAANELYKKYGFQLHPTNHYLYHV